jgi:hypothetical protein
MTMHSLIQWLEFDGNALAVLVAVGAAILFVCCLECSTSPSRDKDDFFHHDTL